MPRTAFIETKRLLLARASEQIAALVDLHFASEAQMVAFRAMRSDLLATTERISLVVAERAPGIDADLVATRGLILDILVGLNRLLAKAEARRVAREQEAKASEWGLCPGCGAPTDGICEPCYEAVGFGHGDHE